MNICLSLGYQIKNPKSPIMHNAGYKALGIDDQFKFGHSDVHPKNIKKAFDGIKALNIRGVSVTMPYKQIVMKFIDKIDKDALSIGAVNTVVNKDGKLIGFNTDWIGAITALENKTNLRNKKVAIFGAGGAARAIIFGLKKKGAVIKIFNRDKNEAKQLAKKFNCFYEKSTSLNEIEKMDIVINATPVGMNNDGSPINKKFIKKEQIIFDCVYSPKETQLIKDAKKIGAKVIYGCELLLYQGVVQFKLYTGLNAPINIMRKKLEDSL